MARKQRVENRDANATNRAIEAVKLRTAGKRWQDVADEAGYASPGAAHDAVMRELKRCSNHAIEDFRAEQMAILERLLEAAMPLALGDPKARSAREKKPNLFAHDRVLGILDRMMKLTGTEIKHENMIPPAVIIRAVPQEVVDAI